MRLARTRRDHAIAFNMTPMINIVFLLIIFFMIVSQITRTVDHAVDLPRLGEGGAKAKPTTITINLDQAGQIVVAGRQLSVKEAITAIKNQLAKSKKSPDNFKIQLRVDRNCESRFVSKITGELNKLEFSHVRVAVSEK